MANNDRSKALLIGGSGLVGQALIRALERAGFDVVSTGLHQTREHRVLDVRDGDAVRTCVQEVTPTVIFLAT
ncbi:MAG TPA: NAD-dependent epimerase/dehydratase family protein, partial [bacterium]|nr:NAD-dependent epimerase/dehydratase family protein [bacterium]